MRAAYLKPRDPDDSGQRGGVSYSDGDDYELEIGQRSNASTSLVALCIHHDEILDVLGMSLLGQMVARSIHLESERLQEKIDERSPLNGTS